MSGAEVTFWLLTAVLTAGVTVYVLTPVMQGKARQKWGWGLVVALPLAALALYIWLGTPQLIIWF